MNSKALLLDMDGVVLDSMPYHVAAWMEALSEHGLRVDKGILYLYEGAIEPDIAVELFSREGCRMDEGGFHSILRRQKELFVSRFRQEVKPFPGIEEVLGQARRAGIRLALVTSSHRDILDAVLPRGLAMLFDRIITGDQVERRKPFPDPYLAALGALGMNGPAGGTAVENAPSGIRSAKAAGLRTVAITTTLSRAHLEGADRIISDHRQLLKELGRA